MDRTHLSKSHSHLYEFETFVSTCMFSTSKNPFVSNHGMKRSHIHTHLSWFLSLVVNVLSELHASDICSQHITIKTYKTTHTCATHMMMRGGRSHLRPVSLHVCGGDKGSSIHRQQQQDAAESAEFAGSSRCCRSSRSVVRSPRHRTERIRTRAASPVISSAVIAEIRRRR